MYNIFPSIKQFFVAKVVLEFTKKQINVYRKLHANSLIGALDSEVYSNNDNN